MGIEVLPATGRWDDFATFMVPRKPGGGGCVCMSYRDARLGMPERIAYMHDECEREPGPGVLAYVDDQVAGWCSVAPKSTRGPTKAQQALIDQEKFWERATSGKPVTAFARYSTAFIYEEGAIVHHAKFGDGVVTRVIDPKKVEILFRDGPKTLAQGMVD